MANKTTRVPAGARRPKDRMAKRPRSRTVTVPMDDQAVHDLDAARVTLEQARQRAATGRDLRAARLMAQRRAAGPTPDGDVYRTSLDTVRAEVDLAIAAELEPLEKAVEQALAHVDDTSRTFLFHALGNTAYQALLDAHKPTDDDHEKVKAEGSGTRAVFHAETFAPALVQACCDDLDEDEVTDMFEGDAWNLAELAHLFMAAYEVNTQRSVVLR